MTSTRITSVVPLVASRTAIIFALALLTFGAACNSAPEQPAAAPTPATPLERGIRQARQQLAKNIYTISRPDNSELTPDDLAFIRNNVTRDRVYSGLTDDRRHVIISMHIPLPPENLAALQPRYAVTQVQTN